MRLVLDTNTVISGLLWNNAPSRLIEPAVISRVSADPDDDHVLACALAAQTDIVVSGDAHLLNLKSCLGIPIVRTTEALELIARR